MDKRTEVAEVILAVAREFHDEAEGDSPIAVARGLQAPLYGSEGGLDSLGLVSFIVAVEQAIEERLGLAITLADEKAMSQQNSPFRTIASLVDYVVGLLNGTL